MRCSKIINITWRRVEYYKILCYIATGDSVAEEEFDRGDRQRGRTKRVTRNEKGETPLHRACIDGKLSKVIDILKKVTS